MRAPKKRQEKKMDKTELEKEIEYLEDKETVWWDAISAFSNDTDGKVLREAFTPEQYRIIKALFEKLGNAHDWHADEDEEPHPILRTEIKNLDERLRNHRHENRSFNSKPDF
jgi:hypothetical protein